MFSLNEKTIIITGGTGFIGNHFSEACIKCGADVIVADTQKEKGQKLVRDLKNKNEDSKIFFKKCDITSINEIEDLIDFTLNKSEKIDVLVNSAYPRNGNYGNKFEDVSFEDFCENVDMHLGGYFLMSKEVSKVMMQQRKGNLINIASIYGMVAPNFSIYEGTDITMPVEYAAIKGAIISLTRYLATYLSKYNIRSNSISPGGVINRQPEEFIKNYCEKTPLGRMAKPKDILGALIFLASDASSYLTGQNLVIDGGWTVW